MAESPDFKRNKKIAFKGIYELIQSLNICK
jgi:hypothetical protein